ncbi:acyltransferase [Streptomyces sp. ISL-100]|uniref:acyltransferase family protein n=1 Tax=Streptomyces sp. ISL-100 TaxID=2819173 RepID=UPI001BEAF760|nr:acyltransferase [Streptomyces sp. ISL-100]MBT2399320.1 acyltransferase [Streptomyces sp. ISL-100]
MESAAGALRNHRLDSLTGARFVAAGLVFLCHIATGGLFAAGSGAADGLMTATKTAGTIGVSFFFVLSGFVLTWSARPGETYGSMLRRRLVKILPNHVVTFALAMVVYAAAATPLGTAVLNLLLLQSWSSDPAVFLSVNGASWSLSCELLFYALFPVLLPLIGRIRAARLWWWAAGVAAAVMVLPLVASVLLPQSPAFPAVGSWLDGVSIERLWFVYVFPLTRLLEFVLGMLMARVVLSGRWIGLSSAWAALLTTVAYVVGIYTPMLFTVAAVTVVPLALFTAALAATDAGGGRTVLAGPVTRRLGEASFAFYLVHGIVLAYAGEQVAGAGRALTTLESVFVSLLALAVSLGLALAMYHWIETPAMRHWGRSWRRAAAAPSDSAAVPKPSPGRADESASPRA